MHSNAARSCHSLFFSFFNLNTCSWTWIQREMNVVLWESFRIDTSRNIFFAWACGFNGTSLSFPASKIETWNVRTGFDLYHVIRNHVRDHVVSVFFTMFVAYLAYENVTLNSLNWIFQIQYLCLTKICGFKTVENYDELGANFCTLDANLVSSTAGLIVFINEINSKLPAETLNHACVSYIKSHWRTEGRKKAELNE